MHGAGDALSEQCTSMLTGEPVRSRDSPATGISGIRPGCRSGSAAAPWQPPLPWEGKDQACARGCEGARGLRGFGCASPGVAPVQTGGSGALTPPSLQTPLPVVWLCRAGLEGVSGCHEASLSPEARPGVTVMLSPFPAVAAGSKRLGRARCRRRGSTRGRVAGMEPAGSARGPGEEGGGARFGGQAPRGVCGRSCPCLWLGRMRIAGAGHQLHWVARKPSAAAGSPFPAAEGQWVRLRPRSSPGRLELSPRRFSGSAGGGRGQHSLGWAIALPGAPFYQHLPATARATQGGLPIAAASQHAPARLSRI